MQFESAEESAEEEETVNKDSATKQEILKVFKILHLFLNFKNKVPMFVNCT